MCSISIERMGQRVDVAVERYASGRLVGRTARGETTQLSAGEEARALFILANEGQEVESWRIA